MRRIGKWLLRFAGVLLLCILGLLAPVGWNAVACRGDAVETAYVPLIDPNHRRAQAATYLTYPEWHIVFAYDDYAKVIEDKAPHNFGYLRAISGFWSALCNLTETADQAGGAPETTRMVYVIGVSFTAELLAKAAYEETIGRITTWLAGARSEADALSAEQARAYAEFLHQVPWYKYDFAADAAALQQTGPGLRNAERRWALGTEYAVKQAYAGVIAQAVAAVGPADLTIRSVIGGLTLDQLRGLGDVTVIAASPEGVQIETPRYAAFTQILRRIATLDGEILEIAGNDRILITATGTSLPDLPGTRTLAQLPRQGYGDTRWLVEVPLVQLSAVIRELDGADAARLEHIFDY